MKFSILTFNVKGVPSFNTSTLCRLEKIGKLLNNLGLDVINLQEVFTHKQLNVLKGELTNYPYCVYGNSLIGPRGGLVTFSRKRIVMSKYASYPYPLRLVIEFIRRGWFRVILRNILSGKGILVSRFFTDSLYVVNTHLITNPTNDWSLSNRFNQIYRISIEELKRVTEAVGEHKLLVLTGDFNIPKTSIFYSILVDELEVKDVFEDVRSPSFLGEFLPSQERGYCLDYIFLSYLMRISLFVKGIVYLLNLCLKKISIGDFCPTILL